MFRNAVPWYRQCPGGRWIISPLWQLNECLSYPDPCFLWKLTDYISGLLLFIDCGLQNREPSLEALALGHKICSQGLLDRFAAFPRWAVETKPKEKESDGARRCVMSCGSSVRIR